MMDENTTTMDLCKALVQVDSDLIAAICNLSDGDIPVVMEWLIGISRDIDAVKEKHLDLFDRAEELIEAQEQS